MCWPALGAAITPILGALGGGAGAAGAGGGALLSAVQVGSAVIGAGSAIYAGQQQAAASEAMAKQARDAVAAEQKRSEDEQLAFYRQVSQLKGQQQAAASAAGLDLSFGSVLDAQVDTALMAREDAERLLEASHQQQRSFLVQRANYKNEADAARTSGYAEGGQYLLGSFSRAASRNNWFGAKPKAQSAAVGWRGTN